jgi:chromosomal replication initiator protein
MDHLPHESSDSSRSTHNSNTDSSDTLVQSITTQLASRLGNHRYDMWFRDASIDIDRENHRLRVATANPFIARWISSHFAAELHSVASDAAGRAMQIDVEVTTARSNGHSSHLAANHDRSRNGAATPAAAGSNNGHHSPRSLHNGRPGRRPNGPRWRRLDDFVVSDTNRVAYGAARQIAEAESGATHSPLFIHGPCGVGKTHLLQATCRHYLEVWKPRPSAARYVTAEQFTNEYISAVRGNRLDEFRRRMRRLELLAIDDVHFLSSKERTQVEFLHTFDEINLSGARVVIASDSHPRQLRQLNQALVNRLLSGMIVQIDLPDLELRRRVAQQLAAARGLAITEQALDAIARECTGSIRELEGMINQLIALLASMRKSAERDGRSESNGEGGAVNDRIGLVIVQQLLQQKSPRTTSPIRIATIIEAVCRRLNVARAELLATGRHKRVVLARSLIAYLAKEMTTRSFPEIAHALGRRNHSTFHNAHRRLREQLGRGESVEIEGDDRPIPLEELANQLKQRIVFDQRD